MKSGLLLSLLLTSVFSISSTNAYEEGIYRCDLASINVIREITIKTVNLGSEKMPFIDFTDKGKDLNVHGKGLGTIFTNQSGTNFYETVRLLSNQSVAVIWNNGKLVGDCTKL